MAVPRTEDVHLPSGLVARSPHEALLCAQQTLSGTPDPGARATALRTMGIARRELGDTETARALLRRSAAVAERAGLTEAAAHARASHQGLRALRGEGGVSGVALDRMAATSGSAGALALVHRGVAEAQRGRFDTAIAHFNAARDHPLPRPDGHVLAGLLSNRGLAFLYSGRLSDAEADLRHALALAEDHALGYLRGITQQNLGCLAVRNGDVAQAVSRFTAAAALVPRSRAAALSLDHAEALLAAGMAREAATLLSSAPAPDATADEAIARLLKAKVHLRSGRRDAALVQTRHVRSGFTPDSLWAHLARRLERAAAASPNERPSRVPGQHVTGDACPSGPTWKPATALRGTGSDDASAKTGQGTGASARSPVTTGAERVLAQSVTTAPLGPPSLTGPDHRHRAALGALAGHDHRGAYRALRRPSSRSAPPTTTPHLELQAHSRFQEREVAGVGAEVALQEGDPATAFHWFEYGRALAVAPARCNDTMWTQILERCRAAHTRAATGDDESLDELRRLTSRLGGAQWHTTCSRPGTFMTPRPPSTAELAAALGDRAFVCFARTHSGAVAITVVDGEVRAHPLAPPTTIADSAAKLLHAARLATLAPASGGVAGPAARVEQMLIAPISAAVGARPLVIAPAPYAQDLPWGMLPALAGRALTVVPSGRAWLDCQQRAWATASDPRRVLLAAGPDLAGAVTEVRLLRHSYPNSTVLAGDRARVQEVLWRLGRSTMAHISAHGAIPTDAPMLSGITLADGPLFAYDLERLPRAPVLTILSSCWGGRSRAAPGGFPLGLGTALLAAGGVTVVAGVLPVADIEVAAAMTRFHNALSAGLPPAQATATHLATSGFVCFGAG